MYPICCKYVLQSLHGQESGFHFLIPDLKRSIASFSFIFAGILSQTFGPKYFILSIPWFTVLTIGRAKSDQLLRLYWRWGFKGKIYVTISGAIPLYILYISVGRALKFLLWIQTESSFASKSWKEDFCRYIANVGIFHEIYLFYCFLCDYGTSRLAEIVKLGNKEIIYQ